MTITEQDLEQIAQAIQDKTSPLQQQLGDLAARLEQVETSTAASAQSSQDRPAHPVGLCRESACETCQAQKTAMVAQVARRTREHLLVELSQLVEASGDAELARAEERIVRLWQKAHGVDVDDDLVTVEV